MVKRFSLLVSARKTTGGCRQNFGLNKSKEAPLYTYEQRVVAVFAQLIEPVDKSKNSVGITADFSRRDRRKFCVIDDPRQYENLRLSQE